MNMASMMQKAQQMKSRMAEMQEEVMNMDIEGESGGGMVKVATNGKGQVRSIDIQKDILNPDDKEMIEDLVTAAINDSRAKAEALISEKTKKIMTDLGLPADMDFPM
jgi:DNA-binding YbaB/EbfC family protein